MSLARSRARAMVNDYLWREDPEEVRLGSPSWDEWVKAVDMAEATLISIAELPTVASDHERFFLG